MNNIRSYKNEDLDRVMQIWLSSTIKAHDFIDKKYWQDNYAVVKDVYIPMAETLVYEEDGIIEGFISIIDKSFIGALFVDTNCQGKGIGSRLIDCACKEYGKLSLAVYKDNKNAFEFYNKKGFKIIQEQKNEDSGYDEYIMQSSAN